MRFNCETGRIIHQKLITLQEIENELQHRYGIETQELFQKLWNALDTFNGFPEGDYLLQSNAKVSNQYKIYKKCDKRLV